MGKYFEQIPESLIAWILDQKVFWVATAPLAAAGHVNVSPKGGSTFGILGDNTFWYMDMTGSGNETISHLYENGRITVLFNAFEGPPKIIRLFGRGRVLEHGTQDYTAFVEKHAVHTIAGTRSVVVVAIHQVGSSCGYAVPFYDFKAFRPTLDEHFAKKEKRYLDGKESESMPRYWALTNAWSVDGLPGLKIGQDTLKKEGIVPRPKMVGAAALTNRSRSTEGTFTLPQLVICMLFSAVLSATAMLFRDEVTIFSQQVSSLCMIR